jgi:D-methionine transport system substrate-binding protein
LRTIATFARLSFRLAAWCGAVAVCLLTGHIAARATEVGPLRVIASAVPHAEILRFVQRLAPDLPLKIIEINSAPRPNELLARGEADANYFQHVPYLRQQEKDLGIPFAVIATVHIEPLGIYSRRLRALADLKDHGTVSIPNNVVNLSRALFLLQDRGLIRLRADLLERDRQLATPRDIDWNPKQLKIIPVDSAQIARSLDDVDVAVVNGNYALEVGLIPSKDALALEKPLGNPYANVLVSTPELEHDPRVQRLGKLLTSPQVAGRLTDLIADPCSRLGCSLLPGRFPAAVSEGQVFDLVFADAEASSPALTALAGALNVRVQLLAGGIESVAGRRVGRMQIAVTGAERAPDPAAVLAYLSAGGARVSLA